MIVDVLALVVLLFMFWGDSNGVDNWDKLDAIIDAHYRKTKE